MKNRFKYVSGMDANQIGDHFNTHYEDGDYVYGSDFSNYDSCQGILLGEIERFILTNIDNHDITTNREAALWILGR